MVRSQEILFHRPFSSLVGILQAPLTVTVFPYRGAFGTVGTGIEQIIEGRLLTGSDPVLHLGIDAAPHRS